MKLKEKIEIKKAYFKAKKQKFRRDTQKLAIKLIKFFSITNRVDQVNNSENEIISLCRKLIRNQETILSMTPRTHKRIVENKKTGSYIIIRNMQVIVYHQGTAYPPTLISDKKYQYLLEIFDDKKENIEENKENDIEAEVKHSFKKIYDSLVKMDNENIIK